MRADRLRFGRRLNRESSGRTPITVVTGFLGSGKTSLIKTFLGTPAGRATAVIVNEFGEVGIDDVLLRESSDAVVLLGNGCLCCSTRGDLEETFRALMADAAAGRIPSFDRVIIETSGLADPGPILQTFSADRGTGGLCHLETVLTVVDALNLQSNEDIAECRRQIAFADRLVLTNSDVAGEVRTTDALERVGAMNAHAHTVIADRGSVDPQVFTTAPAVSREASAMFCHTDGISSFVQVFAEPVPWEAFSEAMRMLTALRGNDLLRVKGLIAVEGCSGPVVVQQVGHIMHPPAELAHWPEGTRSALVFITRNLAQDVVAGVLAAALNCRPLDAGRDSEAGGSR